MKKIVIPSILQFIIVFLVIGGIAYFVRGDFFFRFLAPIFGLAAGLLRLASSYVVKILHPELYEREIKK
ncbi:hypothetical protein Q8F60_08800 [Streptococcus constellatus]|jgi:hypothetical protein|uniref:Excreted peptide n=3 Tax=Streptococcus anginosus group TaxID=671232 RepID=T1ZH55_STRIT|nr:MULTISPECIES: hypothetical protein [Streptococcus]RKV74622.1 MAG: hypothetical protein D8H99_57410 [Streptococcus sp.]AGU77160.1 hypothetical protein SIR_1829 [Streptococcus intermedius B196]AGU78936.1 hypothetical protein SII_1794 [Streptococcus intermedius C270]EHG11250.1 hypothetical protein HMPREF9177_01829 [Streptococcus intermedius F0413]EID23105.1 hypothetical protein HMPREF1044_1760 [Streptococcus constellatus subsp. constellatus SK53]